MMRAVGCLLGLLFSALPATAHPSLAGDSSILSGLVHPVLGLDHIVTIVAVGFWARLSVGSSLYLAPIAFIGAMVAGFAAAIAGFNLTHVEPATAASVVVVGLIIIGALHVSLSATILFVSSIAAFHGHAHGTEVGQADALPFLFGFVISTAGLQLLGMQLASYLASSFSSQATRWIGRTVGGSIAAFGVLLAIGAA